MTATATLMDTASAAEAPAMGRALASNMLDRRTKEWRRRAELIATFTAALGGQAALSPILAEKVSTAAELAVAAEMTRSRFMRGDAVSPDDVVRTANQAQRAERALGIDARAAKPKPSLDDYLASKAA